ncbi:MAG: hypothetical protein ABIR32_20930 [Ilumatobacteraceae bacterium]
MESSGTIAGIGVGVTNNDASKQDDDISGEDILEAFNAEGIVERPGEPPLEPLDDASNSDAPAPG